MPGLFYAQLLRSRISTTATVELLTSGHSPRKVTALTVSSSAVLYSAYRLLVTFPRHAR